MDAYNSLILAAVAKAQKRTRELASNNRAVTVLAPSDWRTATVTAHGHRAHFEKLLVTQAGICGGCGRQMHDGQRVNIDHVVPRALGGGSGISNLLIMHERCNSLKADFPPSRDVVARNMAKNRLLDAAPCPPPSRP